MTVTMGSAPTSGNLLIAISVSSSGSPTAATGWTQIGTANSSGAWYQFIWSKTAGGGESTSQTPCVSSGNTSVGIWEINGQAGSNPIIAAVAAEVSSTLFAATAPVGQTESTLYLAGIVAQSNAAITNVVGMSTIDVNQSSGAGAKAAYAHCDSHSAVYTMGAAVAASTTLDTAFILVTA